MPSINHIFTSVWASYHLSTLIDYV
jgi:hypothetical protein